MNEPFKIEPHPDIELAINRKRVEYFITSPEKGINNKTGLFLFVSGYGMNASSKYEKKTRQYFANKTNCMCAGINYFGIGLKGGENAGLGYEINTKFMDFIRHCYGIQPNEYILNQRYDLSLLSNKLQSLGIAILDSRCKLTTIDAKDSYLSFGFLPALDLLCVVGEILKKFKLNKKKILAFGTSYGGYLSLLASKFAPNTFSSIIDNSGFVTTRINEIIDNGLDSFFLAHTNINGVLYPYVHKHPWTILDAYSPFYFSDSHRMIRSLLEENHLQKTRTKYFIYHSANDEIAPIAEKEKFIEILNRYADVFYKKISENDVDGKTFKNASHGMNASMKGLFDLVAEKATLEKESSFTDFDLESRLSFNCNNKNYIFDYDKSYNLSVRIKELNGFQNERN